MAYSRNRMLYAKWNLDKYEIIYSLNYAADSEGMSVRVAVKVIFCLHRLYRHSPSITEVPNLSLRSGKRSENGRKTSLEN